ncbi:MAG: T9SS type A sorting domain-containing protein [Ignavibacteriae bacterium]|nr:T9SS C-terminal target domain-containing protein [Ignavibacteriota bacterium]NOG96819.1 T9SS type A sorting domain-containing protein [Ignavibacteriota bacterium]
MQRIVKYLFIQCSLILFVLNTGYAQHSINSSAQSGAGGIIQGGTYTLNSTIGQSSPSGFLTGGTYGLTAGYISTLLSTSDVDNISPNISHTAIGSAPSNQIILIQAEITDNIGVASANIFFRRGGDASFTSLVMLPTGDIFNGAIPAATSQLTGVEYYIEAVDAVGNTARHPNQGITPISISITGEGLQKTTAQPSGNSQNAYRLISIPLAANNRTPAAVLADDLGSYDPNTWRLFSLQADQTYAEFPNSGTMDPGKAFWLIVRDAGKFIDTGPASSNLTNAPFTIPLNAGWTFIGNPFNFPIPQSKLTLGNSGTLDIRSYSGVWNNYTGSLQPFDGYAVSSNTATTLSVDPQLTAPAMNKNLVTSTAGFDWSIDIIASCQDAKDIDNKIAVNKDAEIGWDKFDKPEPPQIGKFVSVKFSHEEWEKVFKHYCVDVRPSIAEGETWDFEVETNIEDKVKISFEKVNEVPENYEVWLVDNLLKTTQNIRAKTDYEFKTSVNNKSKKLKLLVGDENFIKKEFADMQLIPNEFKLHQNFPNPFNPTTNILFSIPREEKVVLKIYNVLGKQVSTLLNEVKPAGTYLITFDGKSLASGVYFYSIEAGTFISTKKFILLK